MDGSFACASTAVQRKVFSLTQRKANRLKNCVDIHIACPPAAPAADEPSHPNGGHQQLVATPSSHSKHGQNGARSRSNPAEGVEERQYGMWSLWHWSNKTHTVYISIRYPSAEERHGASPPAVSTPTFGIPSPKALPASPCNGHQGRPAAAASTLNTQ